ncbi:MAG: hypothetical protein KA230_04495 [Flavobacteriales bacterium]|mgnify:CR=1 FL=1|nr:hypothetical protein [Flavobacteriales bacterium]
MQRPHISVLILVSYLITSCGSGSLEDKGRDLGGKRCECKHINWQFDAEAAEAMLDAMKDDANLSWDSAEVIGRKNLDEHREERDLQEEACRKELKEMSAQVLIDFPKDEDRKTLKNLLDAIENQCEQQQQMETKELEMALKVERERTEQQAH